jgi:hypothetical protein
MRRSYLIVMGLALIVTFTMARDICAAGVGEDFYRGKVIRIVVGFSAGGGFDTYARTLSRSMGKYIPWSSDGDRGKHDRCRESHRRQSYLSRRQA